MAPKTDEMETMTDAARLAAVAPSWQEWLNGCFPPSANFCRASGYDAHQYARIWDWFARVGHDASFKARLALLSRSPLTIANVDMGVAFLEGRKTRRFVLYVCETQDKADERVHAVAEQLTAHGVFRSVERHGNSGGWKFSRLRTDSGFTVAGIGLKTVLRGARMGVFRPDLILLDGLDASGETRLGTLKTIRTLTQTILPTSAPNCAVAFLSSVPAPGATGMRTSNG